jgi:hypothetical protein
MSGNFIKPPSRGESGSPVNMPLICEATGVPTQYMTQDSLWKTLSRVSLQASATGPAFYSQITDAFARNAILRP